MNSTITNIKLQNYNPSQTHPKIHPQKLLEQPKRVPYHNYHLGEYVGGWFETDISDGNGGYVSFPAQNIRAVIPKGTTYIINGQPKQTGKKMPRCEFLELCDKQLEPHIFIVPRPRAKAA